MKRLKNIAIIPARGGSKRIPRKNIKKFLGKPIIAYSIEAAISSNLFDEIMVSTDDDEIAAISEKYGAKVPFMRSKENADDYSNLANVLIEVIQEYLKHDIQIQNVCCILPTAPFVTSYRLIEGNEVFIQNKYDSLFPILEFSYPVKRSLVKKEDGTVKMAWPEHLDTRSQDLEPHFHDSGQYYYLKTKSLLENKSIFTDNSGFIELSQLEVQDIDNPDDWKNAEIKYQILNG